MTDSVYRPTRNFCETMLKRLGIEVSYYDPTIGAGIAALFRPNTRAVWTEAPGSQTFEMQDIPAIVEAAHARDIVVMMDNTWATPLFFDSHKHGVDISVQAGTKYYAGHSDVLIGTISARTPELYKQLRQSWEALGVIIATGGRLPDLARHAHHVDSPEGADAGRPRHGRVARRAPRGRPRAASGAAETTPAMRSGSATSPAPPRCSRSS